MCVWGRGGVGGCRVTRRKGPRRGGGGRRGAHEECRVVPAEDVVVRRGDAGLDRLVAHLLDKEEAVRGHEEGVNRAQEGVADVGNVEQRTPDVGEYCACSSQAGEGDTRFVCVARV